MTALGTGPSEIQVNAALHNDELTEIELKEMAIFLTHYAASRRGPSSTERWHARRPRSGRRRRKGEGEDKKANVNAAVKMHSGGSVDDK